MPLKASQMGGRIPGPVRVTLESGTGQIDTDSKTFFQHATGDKPEGPSVGMSLLIKKILTAPAAVSTTAFISTGLTGAGKIANTNTITLARGAAWDGTIGAAGKPDFARNVVVTVTHATSVVAMTVVVAGVDIWGNAITESISIAATGTTQTGTGLKAFYRIDSIAMTATGNAEANTLTLGTGQVFGLDFLNPIPSLVTEMIDTTLVTTGTTVAGVITSTADKRGTYSPATAPNATHSWTIWYICDDPTLVNKVS